MTIKEEFKEKFFTTQRTAGGQLLWSLPKDFNGTSDEIYNFFAEKMKEIITEVYTQAPKDVAKWVDENIQEDWELYKSRLLQDLFNKYGL